MIIYAAVIFFFVILEVSCVKLSGAEDAKIRKALLGSLKRFHQGQPGLSLKNMKESGKNELFNLPFDVLSEIVSAHLGDLKSLINLSRANVNTCDFINHFVSSRLIKFCPHFATNDFITNTFLYLILKEHFFDSKSIHDEAFHDELQILGTKYFFKQLSFDFIPRNIYHYVLNFLHEISYGLDASIPHCLHGWTIYTVRLLRKHKLEKFWKYTATLSKDLFYWSVMLHFYENFILIDVSQNPKRVELIKKYSTKYVYSMLLDEVLEFIDPDNLQHYIYKCTSFGVDPFSKFYDEYLSLIQDKWACSRHGKSNSVNAAKLIASEKNYSTNPDFYYFITRTSIDQFNISDLTRHPFQSIREIAKFSSLSLAHIDGFSQLIKSDSLTTDQLSSVLTVYNNPVIFELIVKEAVLPIGIFYHDKYGDLNLTFKGNYFDIIIDSFFDNLKSKDPFIFLTISLSELKMMKSRITDKFDLNKRYTFDLTIEEAKQLKKSNSIEFESSEDSFDEEFKHLKKSSSMEFKIFGRWIGKTISFKEIVNASRIFGLKEIFSSNADEFDDLSTVDMVSEPISINSRTLANFY
jgi:hypothetical protein